MDVYITEALAISENGNLGGRRWVEIKKNIQPMYGVTWIAGVPTQLDSLDATPGNTVNVVNGINDAGVAVGFGYRDRERFPVRWVGTAISILPQIGDRHTGLANSINNDGLIVGESGHLADAVPTLWKGDSAIDINSLLSEDHQKLWKILTAVAINNRGQITGTIERRADHSDHTYVLTPR